MTEPRNNLGTLVSLFILGAIAFVFLGIVLEQQLGIPSDTSYRIACAVACLAMIFKLALGYKGQQWPWIAFVLALAVNLGLFFTPIVDRPTSRGEIWIFALPDAAIFLLARIITYPVLDMQQRAERQQLILAFVVALISCVFTYFLALVMPSTGV